MSNIQHIYMDSYEYKHTEVDGWDENGPIYIEDYAEVQVSWCGLEDYAGKIDFVGDPSDSTCSNCVDECALHLLRELNDD